MSDKKEVFLLARVEDVCKNNNKPYFFDFYNATLQKKMEKVAIQNKVPYALNGGADNAERKMLCIYNEFVGDESLEWPIMAATFSNKLSLDHRNVLGEIMAMGITRECLGDIFVSEDSVQIIFTKKIYPFLKLNLNKMKGKIIDVKYLEFSEIKNIELRYQSIMIVVASDRVDGIIAKIWGLSRQDSLILIKQGRVQVNYEVVTKSDSRLKGGDVISIRRKGKAMIKENCGTTKKGNIRLEIYKYI